MLLSDENNIGGKRRVAILRRPGRRGEIIVISSYCSFSSIQGIV
jgi:hypothetical protein